eukprot:jgi/Galph1/5759/GphlegSOOS_G4356.1
MVQLFVKDLSGNTNVFSVEGNCLVSELRLQIAENEQVSPNELRIYSGATDLEDDWRVQDIQQSNLYTSLRILGGGKKKRKKSFTKPKKIKHKPKKVPLRVLKYYKVADDGKVTRLRRQCPNPTCGPGVFMAAHRGRQYCGKCGLTYVVEGK